MNILLDTNIIIPLEDTNKILGSSFAELRRLSAEQHHCLYIRPMQFQDINRDKIKERREIVISRLAQYSQIENPPILSEIECLKLGLRQVNDNDKVDNNVLFALYRGAVQILVTNDEGIHKKSIKLGIQDNLFNLIKDTYEKCTGFIYVVERTSEGYLILSILYNILLSVLFI